MAMEGIMSEREGGREGGRGRGRKGWEKVREGERD